MNVIYKYKLNGPIHDDTTVLELPNGAQVLSVQLQGKDICLWALVDPTQHCYQRIFKVYWTGHSIEEVLDEHNELLFIGTLQTPDGLQLHVFEKEINEL